GSGGWSMNIKVAAGHSPHNACPPSPSPARGFRPLAEDARRAVVVLPEDAQPGAVVEPAQAGRLVAAGTAVTPAAHIGDEAAPHQVEGLRHHDRGRPGLVRLGVAGHDARPLARPEPDHPRVMLA